LRWVGFSGLYILGIKKKGMMNEKLNTHFPQPT
jgi:hypothetical protein